MESYQFNTRTCLSYKSLRISSDNSLFVFKQYKPATIFYNLCLLATQLSLGLVIAIILK